MAKKRTLKDYTEVAKEKGPYFNKRAVILDNECWIIPPQSADPSTYTGAGITSITWHGGSYKVQRLMYVHYKGHLNPTSLIDSSCGRGNCVNPDHLSTKKAGNPRFDEARAIASANRVARKANSTPTPVKEPEVIDIQAMSNLTPQSTRVLTPPPNPKTASLSEEEIHEIKALLRLMRGVRAYMKSGG